MSYDSLEKKTYTLYLNSNNSLTTSINNTSFHVDYSTFLPEEYNLYKVRFNFVSVGGFYKDGSYNGVYTRFNLADVYVDFGSRNFSYSPESSGPTLNLGFIKRDTQTSSSVTNYFSASYLDNPPKTITRPSNNVINVQIYNIDTGKLLVDTSGSSLANDMNGEWVMALEFIPIEDSKRI